MNNPTNGVSGTESSPQSIFFITESGEQKEFKAEDLQKCFGKPFLGKNWNRIKLAFSKGIWVNNNNVQKLLGNMTFEQLKKLEEQYNTIMSLKATQTSRIEKIRTLISRASTPTTQKVDSFKRIIRETISLIQEREKEKAKKNVENFFRDNKEAVIKSPAFRSFVDEKRRDSHISKPIDKKDLEKYLLDFENALFSQIESWDFDKGSSSRDIIFDIFGHSSTFLPAKLSGGITKPKKNQDVDVMLKALASNVEKLRKALIAQIPRGTVDLSQPAGKPGTFFPNDNYVLTLAMHPGISYDADTDEVTVTTKEGTRSFKRQNGYMEKGRCVFSDGRMCDDGLQLEETFGNKFAVHSFNDGNGWGGKSERAASTANKIAVKVLKAMLAAKLASHREKPMTHQDIIRFQDRALFAAQSYLVRHRKDEDPHKVTGTTCPQLLTVAGDTAHISSIGDTKTFIISSDLKAVFEPTQGNRGGFDPCDPGGRIGPYLDMDAGGGGIDPKDPDLRNYSHSITRLNPGDIVIMCSDGIHDNLDPATLGMSPQEVDPNLQGNKWDDNNTEHVAARNRFVGAKLQQILQDYKRKKDGEDNRVTNKSGKEEREEDEREKGSKKSPLTQDQINDALFTFIQNSSLKRKLAMMETTGKEPESKKDFPGKFDHAGLIVYHHPFKKGTEEYTEEDSSEDLYSSLEEYC